MAQKRMFSKAVINADAFIELSYAAQALYLRLGVEADDDGIVNNSKMILRIMGLQRDCLQELEENGMIYVFDSGNVIIRHWKINNSIQKDRYHSTIYTKDFNLISLDSDGVYILDTNRIQNVYADKERKESDSDKNSLDEYMNREGAEGEGCFKDEAELFGDLVREYLGEERTNNLRLLDVTGYLNSKTDKRQEQIKLLQGWIQNGERPI